MSKEDQPRMADPQVSGQKFSIIDALGWSLVLFMLIVAVLSACTSAWPTAPTEPSNPAGNVEVRP